MAKLNLKQLAAIGKVAVKVAEAAGIKIHGIAPKQIQAAVEEALTTEKKIAHILKPTS